MGFLSAVYCIIGALPLNGKQDATQFGNYFFSFTGILEVRLKYYCYTMSTFFYLHEKSIRLENFEHFPTLRVCFPVSRHQHTTVGSVGTQFFLSVGWCEGRVTSCSSIVQPASVPPGRLYPCQLAAYRSVLGYHWPTTGPFAL